LSEIKTDPCTFIKETDILAMDAVVVSKSSGTDIINPQSSEFNINTAFTEFMCGIGGSPLDAGGNITFTGQDPIVRSHFRIASSMAIPAMAAGVCAASIWKDRTGQDQDLTVDLRESIYNINPIITMVMKRRIAVGHTPANDAVAKNFSFIPTVNGRLYQVPLAMGNPLSFSIFPTRDDRFVTITGVYPQLLDRALNLLGAAPNKKSIASAIKNWDSSALDEAMASSRVVGAIHRSRKEWLQHPQGKYLSNIPLIEIVKIGDSDPIPYTKNPQQPLSGIKALSLTHVIAGSCAARTLAEYGAEVLHIARDQAFEHEGLVTDVNIGMRSAFLDLRQKQDSGVLSSLLPQADVFIESFSGRSIEKLGFGPEEVSAQRPGIIYLSLRCYGWDGPWCNRGGFDMEGLTVSGYTMQEGHAGLPAFPPTLVLNDYIAGYFGASGIMAALRRRAKEGGSYHVRVSLTRAAMWYQSLGTFANTDFVPGSDQVMIPPETIVRQTPYGEIIRLAPLVKLSKTPGHWPDPLVVVRGSDKPAWAS
jgi:crotonobetainyl-CoA:carnitine CoA-transferase CaiB-like acyl-CoA transferase